MIIYYDFINKRRLTESEYWEKYGGNADPPVKEPKPSPTN